MTARTEDPMNAPDHLARIEARLDRMEAMLERLTSLLDQAPAAVAMGGDVFDEWARERQAEGVDLDARLDSASHALLKLTEPRTLDALGRLAGQAERLETVVGLTASFDDYVAMAGDVFDEAAAGEAAAGRPVDERLRATLALVQRISEPDVLRALGRLAEYAPRLETVVSLASQFDDNLAILFDAIDEWFGQRAAAGADPASAAEEVLRILQRVAEPEVVSAVHVLVDQAPLLATQLGELQQAARDEGTDVGTLIRELTPALRQVTSLVHTGALQKLTSSPLLDPAFLDTVTRLGAAAAQALSEPPRPTGVFGAIGAMGDPDVKRAVGAGINVARHVGATLDQPLVRK